LIVSRVRRVIDARWALAWRFTVLLGLVCMAWAVTTVAHAQTPPQADKATFDYKLKARALATGVWVVEGANADFTQDNGCNIINTGFIATGAGVVVINTGPSRLYGEQLRQLVERTTPERIVQVIHLNLHPDYFLGNQAFANVPTRATTVTREGMAREGKAYEDNLYKACGDWMKGTQFEAARDAITPGPFKVGTREFDLQELRGHTQSDLVLIDKASGVMFAGGLVFADRIPTTPHAEPKRWLASLATLAAMKPKLVVPSHGPVHEGLRGIEQTRDYVRWLDQSFTTFASQGLDMNDVLRAPMPAAFKQWAAYPAEYVRNVAHLYKGYESTSLSGNGPSSAASTKP
jgi:quinoprotein relay system zinc metallohydrolase 1